MLLKNIPARAGIFIGLDRYTQMETEIACSSEYKTLRR